MYSLNCSYYTSTFRTLDDLLSDIIETGQDPDYDVLLDGEPIGQTAWDLIAPSI